MIHNHMFLRIAKEISVQGTCPRAQVGAVIVRRRRIISTGYNGAPSHLPHCTDVGCEVEAGGCTNSTHAEANAIAFAAKEGIATGFAELYCTHTPCIKCAQLIINSGIIRVYTGKAYRDMRGADLLKKAGVEVIQCYEWQQTP